MGNILKYTLFTVLLTFIYTFNVNADCSYQERKDLLNQVKNVDAYFEPDLENQKFVFKLYNLTPDIFAKLEVVGGGLSREIHSYDMVDGYYSYVENNITDKIVFDLVFYSMKSECYGNELTSKRITKGIMNKFYNDPICKDVEDYNYCKPIINNKFFISDSEVYEKIREYKESIRALESVEEVESNFFIDFIKENWKYILIIILFISVISTCVYFYFKKRGELK